MVGTFFHVIDSPVGPLTLVRTGSALCGIYFDGHTPAPTALRSARWSSSEGFEVAARQLEQYFAGERRHFDVPVAPVGTDFQLSVWAALRSIPYGRTLTYTELAAAAGRPGSVRAAASANARNPLSIVQPCHRVIGTDGSLTGFAGGLARKRFLLELERG